MRFWFLLHIVEPRKFEMLITVKKKYFYEHVLGAEKMFLLRTKTYV